MIMIAYAQRGDDEYTLVLEVKSKPRLSDVVKLAGLAESVARSAFARGRVIPVLAGVWVGGDVEAYARRWGVEVLKL